MPTLKRTRTLWIAAVMASSGCVDSPPDPNVEVQSQATAESPAPEADADSHLGPHKGKLIPLGEKRYHAELLHDNLSVTVYLLDGEAKQLLPIESDDILIDLLVFGDPRQYRLKAFPDPTDPPGRSSRFMGVEEKLTGVIGRESSRPQLTVTIDGVSWTATIPTGP